MANSEFGRLLLACTREHDWDQPPRDLSRWLPHANSLSFVDHACLHGVEACVHLSLRSVDAIPQETRDQLEEAYFVALRSHACALHDLAIAAEWFPLEEEAAQLGEAGRSRKSTRQRT